MPNEIELQDHLTAHEVAESFERELEPEEYR